MSHPWGTGRGTVRWLTYSADPAPMADASSGRARPAVVGEEALANLREALELYSARGVV